MHLSVVYISATFVLLSLVYIHVAYGILSSVHNHETSGAYLGFGIWWFKLMQTFVLSCLVCTFMLHLCLCRLFAIIQHLCFCLFTIHTTFVLLSLVHNSCHIWVSVVCVRSCKICAHVRYLPRAWNLAVPAGNGGAVLGRKGVSRPGSRAVSRTGSPKGGLPNLSAPAFSVINCHHHHQ